MKNAFKNVFHLIQVSALIWALVVLSSAISKANTVNPYSAIYKLQSTESEIVPVQFTFRYPNMGVNAYFISSFRDIKNAEALEAENQRNALENQNIENSELPLEQPHLLGLNGYYLNAITDRNESNFLHIRLK